MSLYCFGKAIMSGSTDAFSLPDDVALGPVDEDDAYEIERIEALVGNGILFSICDDEASRDATGLWMDALRLGRSRILESPFGRAVHKLLFYKRILVGGVAFVDGGIETVLEGTPEDCWTWFLERIEKPWDTIDNPLLIWHRSA